MAFRSTFAPNFDCLVRLGNQGIALGANSLAAWVRFDSLTATYEILEINDSGGTPFMSSILLSGNQIEYTQRSVTSNIDFLGAALVVANTWYHVALTYDGTTLRGYLNGVPNGTSTGLTGVRNNWADLQFGPTLGYLQDGCFYDAALSQAEITQLYLNRLPGRRQNLRIHLPAYAGAANRRLDYSGNGFNFTDNGTPTDSTVPPPQAGWGYGQRRLMYTDASGTPLPSAYGGDTIFDGAFAAQKLAAAAFAGDTLFGGGMSVNKAAMAAWGGATLFGGGFDARKSAMSAFGGDTLFGGAFASPVVVKVASFGGDTLFGGGMSATGGGGPPPVGSPEYIRYWRRGIRRGR